MRIVQISPSAGDSFYCENCLRDATLAKAILKTGNDMLTVPLYLPLQIEQSDSVNIAPIFFGGLNVYLQQKLSFFRNTPRWLDRWLDSPKLLTWVGRKAGMTSARDLGETTISMLRGEAGHQAKELNRLLDWLDMPDNKPDIVCLSNVLLAGLARGIRDRLRVPVVCMLQDEDGFLDGLSSPYSQQAWQVLAERAGDIDAFIAVSKYYGDVMHGRLGFNRERLRIVYTGISLDGYEAAPSSPEIPTIGFLSRMCPDRGLDTLVEAFILLRKRDGLRQVRLRITGGRRSDDEAFLNKMRQRLASNGVIDDVEFLTGFDHRSKLAFLHTLSVLSVPEKQPVAYGLYVLEALAAAVPVVEPSSGVFSELLEMTGGGVLCEPNNPKALADALEPLLLDSECAGQLGKKGRQAVIEKFDIEQTVGELVRIYDEITGQFKSG